jgi:hypothetical protein
MTDWIQVDWNRRPRVLLRNKGMFVLNAFKSHSTLEVRSVIQTMNTDVVVIPGRIYFTTTYYRAVVFNQGYVYPRGYAKTS